MKVSRAILFWVVVIAALLFLEVAQLTHLFSLGYNSIIGNTLSFVFALLFVTVLALVGAVFVGIFIAHRILSPQGFSPFEEEMMRMRQDVHDLSKKVDEIRSAMPGGADPAAPGPSSTAPSSTAGRTGGLP